MKRIKTKIITVFLAAVLMLIPLGTNQVKAAKVAKPVFAYGESLTDEEIEETRRLLGAGDDATEIEVMINELNGLLHNDYPYYQVYSSVYIAPNNDAEGINVEIKTPSTITTITETQYENAAITAGATNVDITVASVKAVDGSGALAGVYKAYQAEGNELPQVNVRVAQKELEVTSEINEENKDKEGYSDDLLNAAIAEIKAQIQKEKEEAGGNTNNININNIVNTIINNYNLQNILSQQNVQQIENLMNDFSSIEFTQEQKNAISEFGQNLVNKGGELLDQARASWDNIDEETKENVGNFFTNLWDAIVQFFNSIVDAVKGLFN